MLVVQTNLAGVKLFSYVNAFFSLKMFVMQIYRNEGKYLHEKKKRFLAKQHIAAFSLFWYKIFRGRRDVMCMKTINSLLEPRSDSTVRCPWGPVHQGSPLGMKIVFIVTK